jgi:multiple antibiotic resistance protein
LAAIEFAIVAISSIVAVMNPLSTTAIFPALTKDFSAEKQHQIIVKSMKISFVVLAFFAITGQLIFQVFNLQVYAFEIAGGILLITFALKMLSEKSTYSTDGREDISIIPLTFPLTAGAGTITTVILLFSEASNFLEAIFVFSGIIIGISLSYLGMSYAPRVFKVFGHDGLRVVTAMMAIIVLALAVQFIINGIIDIVPHIPIG